MSASAEISRLKQALADAKLVCDQMEEESLALKDELQVAKIANKVITAENDRWISENSILREQLAQARKTIRRLEAAQIIGIAKTTTTVKQALEANAKKRKKPNMEGEIHIQEGSPSGSEC